MNPRLQTPQLPERLTAPTQRPSLVYPSLDSKETRSRPNLKNFSANRRGRFSLSLLLGALIFSTIGGIFALMVIPGIRPPKLIVSVISSPPLAEETPPPPPPTATAQPSFSPPSVQATLPPPPTPPPAPVLATVPSMETDFLIHQSESTLDTIARFEEEEAQRQKELLEELARQEKAAEEARAAALVAQQKAAKEKAERDRVNAIRQAAAQKAEAKRAQERAIANREAEARRAQEQAIASREAEARRAAAQAAAQAKQQQRANAALAQKVSSTPSVSRRTKPKYPSSAKRNKIEGTVRITATVTAKGRISSPRITSSSGDSSLDSSALSAVKNWRFKPAKNGLGQAIAYQTVIPVTFQLR